jgi:hypothetical protein
MMTASVNRRFWRFRDGLTAIRGSLFCSLVVVILDVVVDGSYIFSAVVCPIWFIVAVVRAIVRRPTLGLAAARILIPLITLLLVLANYSVQRRIAMANAARLIQACEHYREVNGAYPERLGDLVPRYLNSVPRAKYCFSYSEFVYFGSPPGPTLSWWECPPFGRRAYVFDTGKWRYLD